MANNRNERTRSVVLDDAELLSDAAEDCRDQAFIHGIPRLDELATEIERIAAELRATARI